jgi:NADH-quinone oxidoreductase subunit N
MGLAILATVSIATGTLLAIAQSDIRRLLAYSGVAHAGFILTGLVAGEPGMPAVWFYLAIYAVQLIGAFAVVAAVAGPTAAGSALSDYAGLSKQSPFLAAVLALFMLAMSGVPLTAGFVAKFGVFAAAWRADFEWLVIAALVASVAAFFFYLRVIVLMYMQEPARAEAPGTMLARLEPVGALRWVLIVAAAVTLAFGIYPSPLLDLLSTALPF